MKFEDLKLNEDVLKAVKESGYTEPTPIQEQAIPFVLAGRDVLGIAQTGTGKTASFTLPMICLLSNGRARARMPRSVILCPTRELAMQVSENFQQYGKYGKLTMALLIGGTSFKDQERAIDRGVDVLIATPGRLIDHIERGKLMMTGIEILVIDEADRMLDMGFIPDIEKIVKSTSFTRQTLFFSATMSLEITRLTEEFLHTPERIEVAAISSAAETVEQWVVPVTARHKATVDKDKRNAIRHILKSEKDSLQTAIVFCNRKTDVSIVYRSLDKYGFNVGALHGDLDQSIRTQIMNGFREGNIKILVASDVAARGLDVSTISHVFNFNVPTHSEDYVHRIGRTGRAGRTGKAYTLYSAAEEKYLKHIEELIGRAIDVHEIEGITNSQKSDNTTTIEEKNSSKNRRRSNKTTKQKNILIPNSSVSDTEQHLQEIQDYNTSTNSQMHSSDISVHSKTQTTTRRTSKNNNDISGAVTGMGDHVPAFLLREIFFDDKFSQAVNTTTKSPQDVQTGT